MALLAVIFSTLESVVSRAAHLEMCSLEQNRCTKAPGLCSGEQNLGRSTAGPSHAS